jgi:3-hydroxyacyl-[acyl-carrier-protein] dehydratase
MNSVTRRFGFDFAVGGTHPALPGHFPGNPVVPGALLLVHVLAGVRSESGRTVATMKHVKFTAALMPDETASVDCAVGMDEIRFTVHTTRAGQRIAVANGSLILRGSPT